MMVLGLYAGVFGAFKLKGALTPPPPISFESREEEDFVKRYIAHVEAEEHKPKLLRTPYNGPSGL